MSETPYAAYPSYPAPPPVAPTRNGALAVAALVLAVVALLGVVALAVSLVFLGSGGDDVGGAPLTGRVTPAQSGTIPADSLSTTARSLVEDDGGDVASMRCPSTPSVRQGAVTVCHATIDDTSWAVVVYFEDASGRFTLQPF